MQGVDGRSGAGGDPGDAVWVNYLVCEERLHVLMHFGVGKSGFAWGGWRKWSRREPSRKTLFSCAVFDLFDGDLYRAVLERVAHLDLTVTR